jgi:hypothetical protein
LSYLGVTDQGIHLHAITGGQDNTFTHIFQVGLGVKVVKMG